MEKVKILAVAPYEGIADIIREAAAERGDIDITVQTGDLYHGKKIAEGFNHVLANNDPSAHGEVYTIRLACQALGTWDLSGCSLYTSCEPCPMCLSAIYWAGIRKIYFANTREDAKRIGFDDSFIYDQIPLAPQKRTIPSEPMLRDEALKAFRTWEEKADKVED